MTEEPEDVPTVEVDPATLDEVGEHVARIYSALKSGQPPTEEAVEAMRQVTERKLEFDPTTSSVRDRKAEHDSDGSDLSMISIERDASLDGGYAMSHIKLIRPGVYQLLSEEGPKEFFAGTIGSDPVILSLKDQVSENGLLTEEELEEVRLFFAKDFPGKTVILEVERPRPAPKKGDPPKK